MSRDDEVRTAVLCIEGEPVAYWRGSLNDFRKLAATLDELHNKRAPAEAGASPFQGGNDRRGVRRRRERE